MYEETANVFTKEARLSSDIRVCDNVDLDTIVLEYSDFYFAKFNKYPKLCKKIETVNNCVTNNAENKGEKSKDVGDKPAIATIAPKKKVPEKSTSITNEELDFGSSITVTSVFPSGSESGDNVRFHARKHVYRDEHIMMKPEIRVRDLYPSGSEWQEIADIISREILLTDLNVHWDDIKGLERCKSSLREATVYPIKYPSLFRGKLGFWKGILLYGPPGTGKTMLAKAIATECKCTFFNITSSSIISKWRGESEKYVRVLIELAKYYAPTIIFIDEIDWTTNNAGDLSSSNSEAARRFRAEFLARIDGLLSAENTNVTLLATTNVPWNIDIALLRRLEKRIFVGLPDRNGRLEILQSHLRTDLHSTEEFELLLENTESYSCADLTLLCKEAWMNQLRPIWHSLECKTLTVSDIQNDGKINNIAYVLNAMQYVKPTIKHDMVLRYVRWKNEFGSFE